MLAVEFASAHQYFCTYLFLLQLCEHELCMHFDTLHICCTRGYVTDNELHEKVGVCLGTDRSSEVRGLERA